MVSSADVLLLDWSFSFKVPNATSLMQSAVSTTLGLNPATNHKATTIQPFFLHPHQSKIVSTTTPPMTTFGLGNRILINVFWSTHG